jgi:hypothetical protein
MGFFFVTCGCRDEHDTPMTNSFEGAAYTGREPRKKGLLRYYLSGVIRRIVQHSRHAKDAKLLGVI